MRVAMVMPMSPESAIADVMSQAVPDLSLQWDLHVWCPVEATTRPCPVPLFPFARADEEVVDALSAYDLVVYVLGDSPRHALILPLARRLPGLAVLHDASMTNLVRRVAVETDGLDALVQRVRTTVGPVPAEVLREPDRAGGPAQWLQLCADVPLDDLVVEHSLGAVVHSRWHGERVDGLLLGDVTVAPLPVPSARLGFTTNQGPDPSRLLAALPPDALLLVTVGAVNANRRIDLLLEAVGQDDTLRERVHVWAVGPAEGQATTDVLRQARTLGLQDRFAVTGRVSDTVLDEILSRADIAAALRDPVLEGQSASVLTQLLSGTPVVVYDHAHYAELPDDVAVKVAVADGAPGIARALRDLVDDPEGRRRRGERARDHVLSTRSGGAYAAAILEAGERALARKPQVHLHEDLGARLRRLGLDQEPAVVDVVADLAFELFDLA